MTSSLLNSLMAGSPSRGSAGGAVVENPRPRAFQVGEPPEGSRDHGGRVLPVGIVGDERPAVAECHGSVGPGVLG